MVSMCRKDAYFFLFHHVGRENVFMTWPSNDLGLENFSINVKLVSSEILMCNTKGVKCEKGRERKKTNGDEGANREQAWTTWIWSLNGVDSVDLILLSGEEQRGIE